MLCYGQHGDIRLYRCELGLVVGMVEVEEGKYSLPDGEGRYKHETCCEAWVKGGEIEWVDPHTLFF